MLQPEECRLHHFEAASIRQNKCSDRLCGAFLLTPGGRWLYIREGSPIMAATRTSLAWQGFRRSNLVSTSSPAQVRFRPLRALSLLVMRTRPAEGLLLYCPRVQDDDDFLFSCRPFQTPRCKSFLCWYPVVKPSVLSSHCIDWSTGTFRCGRGRFRRGRGGRLRRRGYEWIGGNARGRLAAALALECSTPNWRRCINSGFPDFVPSFVQFIPFIRFTVPSPRWLCVENFVRKQLRLARKDEGKCLSRFALCRSIRRSHTYERFALSRTAVPVELYLYSGFCAYPLGASKTTQTSRSGTGQGFRMVPDNHDLMVLLLKGQKDEVNFDSPFGVSILARGAKSQKPLFT